MRIRAIAWVSLVFIVFLLACRTVDLVTNSGNSAPASATRAANPPVARASPTRPRGTRDPNAAFDFLPVGTPRCGPGDNRASVVSGTITQNGNPLADRLVQASSGPGAAPISDYPAKSDAQGNYEVTFVCGDAACNGAFWVWMVDQQFEQISPFVEFIFDNQCRAGELNFESK